MVLSHKQLLEKIEEMQHEINILKGIEKPLSQHDKDIIQLKKIFGVNTTPFSQLNQETKQRIHNQVLDKRSTVLSNFDVFRDGDGSCKKLIVRYFDIDENIVEDWWDPEIPNYIFNCLNDNTCYSFSEQFDINHYYDCLKFVHCVDNNLRHNDIREYDILTGDMYISKMFQDENEFYNNEPTEHEQKYNYCLENLGNEHTKKYEVCIPSGIYNTLNENVSGKNQYCGIGYKKISFYNYLIRKINNEGCFKDFFSIKEIEVDNDLTPYDRMYVMGDCINKYCFNMYREDFDIYLEINFNILLRRNTNFNKIKILISPIRKMIKSARSTA